MRRHFIPRFDWSGWAGSALTVDPHGGVELPAGFARSLRTALGQSTRTREYDEVKGRVLCIQWLGLMIEIGFGKVS
ncbi:hypothetical protein SAMN05192583_1411 [Sphingomonas gellani]|uniref:Uncharacterized protein n=1 Tax=Sphingomonas gellani TaxID=1166340 RepID=A0A1H8C105_9SPHN|nr:hypothetical protein [Sphingomonas gellani]SEM88795.1 hypothetical protein SAMN05192583_1411 [Sphingomonas gellani]